MHKGRVSLPKLRIHFNDTNGISERSCAMPNLQANTRAPDWTTANASFAEVINIFLQTLKRRLGFSESLSLHVLKKK